MKKLIITILLMMFHVISSESFRVKRGLDEDEQNKLLEAINKDRDDLGKKLDYSLPHLTYNKTLEEEVSKLDECDNGLLLLRFNKIGEEVYKKIGNLPANKPSYPIFFPESYSIGCSKSFECSIEIQAQKIVPPEFVGKTLEIRGACMINRVETVHDGIWNSIEDSELPFPAKYADILEIKKFE